MVCAFTCLVSLTSALHPAKLIVLSSCDFLLLPNNGSNSSYHLLSTNCGARTLVLDMILLSTLDPLPPNHCHLILNFIGVTQRVQVTCSSSSACKWKNWDLNSHPSSLRGSGLSTILLRTYSQQKSGGHSSRHHYILYELNAQQPSSSDLINPSFLLSLILLIPGTYC